MKCKEILGAGTSIEVYEGKAWEGVDKRHVCLGGIL
jgi:hypothetical protein